LQAREQAYEAERLQEMEAKEVKRRHREEEKRLREVHESIRRQLLDPDLDPVANVKGSRES